VVSELGFDQRSSDYISRAIFAADIIHKGLSTKGHPFHKGPPFAKGGPLCFG
jgi:hypothetical protein